MSTRRTKPSGRLRVGFITPGYGMGGAERWVVTLAKHLAPSLIEVAGILSRVKEGPLAAEAARHADLFGIEEARAFGARCDVVIAWAWDKLGDFRKVYKKRLIAVSHGSPGNQWGDTVTAKMAAVEGVELVGVSAHSLNVWPDGGSKTYLPNGAEVDRCTPRHGREWMREKAGIPAGAKVALFCGRLSAEKRPWAVVDMLPYLPPEWRVMVCGPDQAGWGAAMAKNPRVHVVGAMEHVGDALAAADVFVLPSETEAHPIALCEAWLAGVPTVYCDWPVLTQIRADYHAEPGVAVPLNCSAERLAAGTVAADMWRASLIPTAQRLAWQHFTASAMAARWESYLFGEAMQLGPVPPSSSYSCP